MQYVLININNKVDFNLLIGDNILLSINFKNIHITPGKKDLNPDEYFLFIEPVAYVPQQKYYYQGC